MNRRGIGTVVTFLVACGFVPASSAAPPFDAEASFYSEAVLQGGLTDIAKMSEPELRAFTRYLAECDRRVVNGTVNLACNAAYISYRIEFGETWPNKQRPLDKLLAARELLESKAERGQDARPIDFDRIAKEVLIISKLEDGARARFHSLRAGESKLPTSR